MPGRERRDGGRSADKNDNNKGRNDRNNRRGRGRDDDRNQYIERVVTSTASPRL